MRGDLEWVSIPGLVQSSAERFGAREALVDDHTRLTFRELHDGMRASANAAIAAGVEHGDRVSMWAPNLHEWVIAALGVLAVGGVLVPLNTRFKGDEAAFVLDKSGAKLLFTVTGFLGTDYVQLLRDADVKPPALDAIVALRGDAPDGTRSWAGYLEAGETVDDATLDRRIAAVTSDDLSDIIFTSGTTGRPKGAMITHGQSLRVFDVWSDVVGLCEGDRYLVVNPFFHTFGYKAGWLSCRMRGATAVPHAVFDVASVLERVEAERISVLPGPPTLLQSVLDAPERAGRDLSSLRLTVTGAAVVPVEMVKRLRSEMTFETVLTAYGLTESSGTAAMCRADDDPDTIADWSGRAIPDTELRVVADEGNEVPYGQAGELLVRGYNVMRGYFDEPDETAETIDADGWLHTGDIAVTDERGYVKITDRKKDMFIVGGFNAYPAEIEHLLLGNPQVAQAAVVPDARLGEVGVAFVIARPGERIHPDTLIAWSREHMANYKVPRRVEVVDALPLNASGKVLKHELRERAQEG